MAEHHQEFAVIGLGRFGANLALTLESQGYSVLGIDQSKDLVQRYADDVTQTVALDATDEDALRAVDIAAFDTVIVAIGSNFESNLMTLVALKQLGVRRVICKALSEKQREILQRVGADKVVQPEKDAGVQLARELTSPNAVAHIPLGHTHSISEIVAPHCLINQALRQSNLRGEYDVTVLVVKRGEAMTLMPSAEFVVQPNDVLVVIGPNVGIRKVENL